MLRTVLEVTEGEMSVLAFLSDEDHGHLSSVRESGRIILLASFAKKIPGDLGW